MNNGFIEQLIKKRVDALTSGARDKYEGPILEISDIIQDVVEFSDEEWSAYAFSRERLKDLIPIEDRQRMSKKAKECGIKAAKDLVGKHSSGIEVIARDLNLEIEYISNPNRFKRGEAARFASFTEPNKITIYSDCVDQATKLYKEKGLKKILGEVDFSKALLSHEVFHYIETLKKDEIYTLNEKVKVTKTKLINLYSSPMVLSEIGGMYFASEMLGLNYPLYVFDFLFAYIYDNHSASDLYRMAIRITGHTAKKTVSEAKSKYDY